MLSQLLLNLGDFSSHLVLCAAIDYALVLTCSSFGFYFFPTCPALPGVQWKAVRLGLARTQGASKGLGPWPPAFLLPMPAAGWSSVIVLAHSYPSALPLPSSSGQRPRCFPWASQKCCSMTPESVAPPPQSSVAARVPAETTSSLALSALCHLTSVCHWPVTFSLKCLSVRLLPATSHRGLCGCRLAALNIPCS